MVGKTHLTNLKMVPDILGFPQEVLNTWASIEPEKHKPA